MAYATDEGLGIGVTTIASVAGGLLAKNKDPGRLAGNLKAYNQAIAGNVWQGAPLDPGYSTPLAFLLGKSPTSKGGGGGWATSTAQNDAWTKYVAAKAILDKRKQSAPAGGVQVTPTAAKPISTAGFGNPVIAGMSFPPMLMAGAALAGIYFLSKRR